MLFYLYLTGKLKSKSMTSVTMVSTTAVVRPESRKSVGPRNSNASSDNLSDILIQVGDRTVQVC